MQKGKSGGRGFCQRQSLTVARFVLVAAACAGVTRHGQAQSVDACISAHADGQVMRSNRQLLAAREKFTSCAQPSCPAIVRKDCIQFVGEVSASIPSVVISARDERGQNLTVAELGVDGKPSTSYLGNPLELDPGEHRVYLRLADGRTREAVVVAREQEKAAPVVVEFGAAPAGVAPPPATPGPEPEKGGAVSPAVYVLAGIGVVGLGSFAFFALRGNSTEDELERCAPRCEQDDVQRMRTQYLAADISLGVSVVALGAATYLFLSNRQRDSAARSAWSVSLGGRKGGLAIAAGGHF